jgi:hypothetical protein
VVPIESAQLTQTAICTNPNNASRRHGWLAMRTRDRCGSDAGLGVVVAMSRSHLDMLLGIGGRLDETESGVRAGELAKGC